jgi:hypothetical protein
MVVQAEAQTVTKLLQVAQVILLQLLLLREIVAVHLPMYLVTAQVVAAAERAERAELAQVALAEMVEQVQHHLLLDHQYLAVAAAERVASLAAQREQLQVVAVLAQRLQVLQQLAQ